MLSRLVCLAVLGAVAPLLSAQSPPVSRSVVPSATPGKARPANEAPIDFTPRIGELLMDGIPTRVTILSRGEDRIALTTIPPWIVSGSSSELVMTATEYPQTRITIRRSALPRPAALDPGWVEETSNLILRSVPVDARRAIRDRTPSPLVVNDWKSFEVSIAFDQFGGRFVRGYLFFLNTRGELHEMVMGAREQDYPAVRASAVNVLVSWQEMNARQYAAASDAASAMPSPARPAASPVATQR